MPCSCVLAGTGTLAPGPIRRPESIPAVRFVVAIIMVDLSRCFRFAKTFVVISLPQLQLLAQALDPDQSFRF